MQCSLNGVRAGLPTSLVKSCVIFILFFFHLVTSTYSSAKLDGVARHLSIEACQRSRPLHHRLGSESPYFVFNHLS